MNRLALIALLALTSLTAQAGGGKAELEPANTNIRSKISLINGAKNFMAYCAGCHSLQYQRYNRLARDLGLTEDELEQHLIFTGAKATDTIQTAMTAEQGEKFFGKAPPDLTVIAKARGVDWLYSYLLGFYADPERPIGWNNSIFPNASMPHALWRLEGIKTARFETLTDEHGMEMSELTGFEKIRAGEMSEKEYQRTVRDIVNFLDYVGEPARFIRMQLAPWVLLFLVIFTFLAYLLKREYFKDVH